MVGRIGMNAGMNEMREKTTERKTKDDKGKERKGIRVVPPLVYFAYLPVSFILICVD